jgi:hypothetical protein
MAAPAHTAPSEHFLCPISMELMSDPVIVRSSGITYHRQSIEDAIARDGLEPSTRTQVTCADLIPNRALKAVIDEWLAAAAKLAAAQKLLVLLRANGELFPAQIV